MKRNLFVLLLLALIAVALSACSVATPEQSVAPQESTPVSEPAAESTEASPEPVESSAEAESKAAEGSVESQIAEESVESQTVEESEETAKPFTFGGLTMVLPDGFYMTETAIGQLVAVPEDYPTHTDNIAFTESEGSIDGYSEETLLAVYESLFESVENYQFLRTDGDEYSTVIIDMDYVYSGVPMHMRSCSYFFSGKVVVITFTSVSGAFDEEFAETQQTVQLDSVRRSVRSGNRLLVDVIDHGREQACLMA